MIRLLALRTSIGVWERAISLSGKLSKRTWKFLTVLQCVVLILSAGGLRESASSDPAPPRVTAARTTRDDRPLSPFDLERRGHVPTRKSARTLVMRRRQESGRDLPAASALRRIVFLNRQYNLRVGRPPVVTSFRRAPTQALRASVFVEDAVPFPFTVHEQVLGLVSFYSTLSPLGPEPSSVGLRAEDGYVSFARFDVLPDFRRFFEPTRTVSVQLSQSEGDGPMKALLFWVSLFNLMVSLVSTASTAVVAWISVHRGRADALLKQMQIEKMRLEMEHLRLELERVRLEAESVQPRIILAAG